MISKIIKNRIYLIIALTLFINISCSTLVFFRSEERIGEIILKSTPIGSSKDDVREFISKNGYNIYIDRDRPYTLRGITSPPQPPPIGNTSNPANIRGVSHIWAHIAGSGDIVAVMCAWVFDEDGKLIFVDIEKSWNFI